MCDTHVLGKVLSRPSKILAQETYFIGRKTNFLLDNRTSDDTVQFFDLWDRSDLFTAFFAVMECDVS